MQYMVRLGGGEGTLLGTMGECRGQAGCRHPSFPFNLTPVHHRSTQPFLNLSALCAPPLAADLTANRSTHPFLNLSSLCAPPLATDLTASKSAKPFSKTEIQPFKPSGGGK